MTHFKQLKTSCSWQRPSPADDVGPGARQGQHKARRTCGSRYKADKSAATLSATPRTCAPRNQGKEKVARPNLTPT